MTITRRSIADEIDRMDDDLAGIQADKAETFKAYREKLERDGMAKPEIAVEVTALKAAIRRRRAVKDDPQGVEHKDELTDAIYVEISGQGKAGTVSATRARAQRAKARMSESMADTASLAHEMAADGLISKEAAEETARIAEAVAKKFGNGSEGGNGSAPPTGAPPAQSTPTPAAAASSQLSSCLDEAAETVVHRPGMPSAPSTPSTEIAPAGAEPAGDGGRAASAAQIDCRPPVEPIAPDPYAGMDIPNCLWRGPPRPEVRPP